MYKGVISLTFKICLHFDILLSFSIKDNIIQQKGVSVRHYSKNVKMKVMFGHVSGDCDDVWIMSGAHKQETLSLH